MTEKSYTPQKQSFIDWHAFSYTVGMTYVKGEIIEYSEKGGRETVARIGKVYAVEGWLREDVEFEGFRTRSLAEAKRTLSRVNKTGGAQIIVYDAAFNEYDDEIDSTRVATLEELDDGWQEVSCL